MRISLQIEKAELGPIGTNAYLLWHEAEKEAVLIDAPPDCEKWVFPFLEERSLSLKELWLTHGHWDHMGGASKVIKNETPVVGHRADQMLFEQPQLMSTFAIPGMELEPIKITKWIEHGDSLNLFGHKVEVFHCPGHCPGNVIFWIEDCGVCFVGDVIFEGSVGRADLPGGDFSVLEQSIRNHVYQLPEETIIYPGHGPNTTVRREKAGNPFVRPL